MSKKTFTEHNPDRWETFRGYRMPRGTPGPVKITVAARYDAGADSDGNRLLYRWVNELDPNPRKLGGKALARAQREAENGPLRERGQQRCRVCREIKSFPEDFPRDKGARTGRDDRCKACGREAVRKAREKHGWQGRRPGYTPEWM